MRKAHAPTAILYMGDNLAVPLYTTGTFHLKAERACTPAAQQVVVWLLNYLICCYVDYLYSKSSTAESTHAVSTDGELCFLYLVVTHLSFLFLFFFLFFLVTQIKCNQEDISKF